MNFNRKNILQEKIISNICENEYSFFLNKPNVIGVALGYKVVKGFYTRRKCITVFVTKKLQCNRLLSNEVIPKCYKGIQTDVKQCDMPVCNSLTARVRPVINGYSIGNELAHRYGTAACLVADKYIYILSNNHVFALNNTAPIDSAILQPGVPDGGRIEKDIIGRLNRFIPMKFIEGSSKPENLVDCALCKVLNRFFVSPEIAFVGIPKGTAKVRFDQNVIKVGRTTEMTTGRVLSPVATITVECKDVGKKVLYKRQITTTKMGESGDSGALLLNENNYAAGLYVGTGNNITVFNNIQEVLDSLKVKLVTA